MMKSMKRSSGITLMVLILMTMLCSAVVLTSCGEDDEENSDCAEFNPPAKTEQYGQSCSSLTYGTCPTVFDDCAEGECKSTKNGSICTKSCASTADCPSRLYCSGSLCTKAASCSTFCDGTLCCNYSQDPNDPTECVMGTCYGSQSLNSN